MNDIIITILLIAGLFVFLGMGAWIGLTLMAVAWIGISLFSSRDAGGAMAITLWGSASSWSLTALPLFLLMGEILFRTKISQNLFRGLAPFVQFLPGRLLHTNVIGCSIFAAISGSSAATCATVGKISLPELKNRQYPESMAVGSLAGAGTLGLLIPPSLIMIVYGVSTDTSISKLFLAGIIPGILLAGMFSLYIVIWSLMHPDQIPKMVEKLSWGEKFARARELIPACLLIAGVLGSIYLGFATPTESAALGVLGALLIGLAQKSLDWHNLRESIIGSTMVFAMISFILMGASFLTLSMGYIGLPRHLAEFIATLGLSPFEYILCLTLFYIVLGCFLDGISMVVLTMGVILPSLNQLHINLIWFGIFITIVVEMAQVTPPVGFNLFVLQNMTKIPLTRIAYYALPFFIIMFLMVLILWEYPEIALFLTR